MSDEPQYILEEGTGDDKKVTILEDAFITKENATKFSYAFDGASDITESLRKKQTQSTANVSTHQGRTGYAPCTCTYPDKTSSANMVMTNLVLQYVKTMGKDTAKYGKGFFFVGFPTLYIDQLIKDAKKNSGREVQVKDNVQKKSGYYWISCNSDRLGPDDVTITVMVDGEPKKCQIDARDALIAAEQHIRCNATVSVTASMTSKTLVEQLDLLKGTFSLTIKLLAIDLLTEIQVDVPELVLAEKRKKETRDDSELNIASSMMAKLALSRMSK